MAWLFISLVDQTTRLLDHLLEQGQTSFGITQLQQSPPRSMSG